MIVLLPRDDGGNERWWRERERERERGGGWWPGADCG